MKKNFKILKKITGISCPIFGISWNPDNFDRDKIRKFIVFLEDRRALYNPFVFETTSWVSKSIIEIRSRITEVLSNFDEESETTDILRTMRSACRKYLDKTFKEQKYRHLSERVIENLIGLRSVFGICIGKLSIMYGVDIEETLADIIPLLDDDGKEYSFKKQKTDKNYH